NPELANRLLKLRSHGITRDKSSYRTTNHPDWFYEQQLLGFNYRITDFQCALGLTQLKRHEAFLAARLGEVSPVAQRLHDAHAGGKSLGAWGGDFALVIAPEPEALHYLSSHGMGPILSWKEVCGG
ncbi:MAG: hypothetical protein EBZ31_04815, partial [Flavobacteriia bacterium]|nr:hypothetical protein [Flavobacteriia bacterium]